MDEALFVVGISALVRCKPPCGRCAALYRRHFVFPRAECEKLGPHFRSPLTLDEPAWRPHVVLWRRVCNTWPSLPRRTHFSHSNGGFPLKGAGTWSLLLHTMRVSALLPHLYTLMSPCGRPAASCVYPVCTPFSYSPIDLLFIFPEQKSLLLHL